MRQLRLRFSLRTLLFLVTLVGIYFGAWEVTDQFAVLPTRRGRLNADDEKSVDHIALPIIDDGNGIAAVVDAWSPAPLFVVRDEFLLEAGRKQMPRRPLRRRYYFWLFGPSLLLRDKATLREFGN